jgi:hypothetical protein
MSQLTQANSYEANAIACAINMLAQSPTFQSILPPGVSPLSYIVESWGGTIDWNEGQVDVANTTNGQSVSTLGVHAIVHEPEMQDEYAGPGAWHHRGTTRIRIYQQRQIAADESARDVLLRGRNVLSGIRWDINQLFGTVPMTVYANGECKSDGPYLPDEAGVDAWAMIGELLLAWWA